MSEKDYYEQSIVKMIKGIDRVDLLIYLNRLISNILKNVKWKGDYDSGRKEIL